MIIIRASELNNPKLKMIFKGREWNARKHIKYLSAANAFDIETSSFVIDGEKRACMYIWQLGLNERAVIIGRTWDEFVSTLNSIADFLKLNENKKLIIYVHNLSYEFQFLRKWLEWKKVFATKLRKVLYAETECYVFKCSYFLSGEPLANVAKHLTAHSIDKLIGDLDYSVLRTPDTELTDEELQYCINDVIIVMFYIREKIDSGEKITKIPLTKTGYVRNYLRHECFYSAGKSSTWNYLQMMEQLQINDLNEYNMLHRAFQGGFTHGSHHHTFRVEEDAESMDFISDYPAIMLLESLPMGRGCYRHHLSGKDFNYYLKYYHCVFDVTFYGIEEKLSYDHPISGSKCYNSDGMFCENGRLVYANQITMTITEKDYAVYKEFYSWEKLEIGSFLTYAKGYLPKAIQRAVLKLYKDKTELKDVEGMEHEYALSKELLNSCYGAAVTAIIRDDYVYDPELHEWLEPQPENKEEQLKKYNESKSRFLFYPWGVWITATSRYNLFKAIMHLKKDYIYSDTDSVKFINPRRHDAFFQAYNNKVIDKIKKASKQSCEPISAYMPYTIKGEQKIIGTFECDGRYKKIKVLGAKRYLTESDKGLLLTCAGVSKKSGTAYLQQFDDPFAQFDENLVVPAEFTDKLTHIYVDNEYSALITDYQGHQSIVHELSYIHLQPAEFSLKINDKYIQYIFGMEDEEF